MWLPDDMTAALEWQEYEDSLCSGCGRPRAETMAEPPSSWTQNRGRWEERYDAVELVCAACAARDRKRHSGRAGREPNDPPPAGVYLAIVEQEQLNG